MTRLLDVGIDHIRNIILDMANISENSVFTAMESYEKGLNVKSRIFEWSERLRILQEEVSDLAVELIARYQPVASDLRMIRSCIEISYGFSRFGRYSYDIADLLETIGFTYNDCDKTAVLEMAKKVREMILLSVAALQSRDKNAVSKFMKWMIRWTHYIGNTYKGLLSQKMRGNRTKSMLKKQTLDAMDPPY